MTRDFKILGATVKPEFTGGNLVNGAILIVASVYGFGFWTSNNTQSQLRVETQVAELRKVVIDKFADQDKRLELIPLQGIAISQLVSRADDIGKSAAALEARLRLVENQVIVLRSELDGMKGASQVPLRAR